MVLNRLEPIFEPVFDEANFGYRRGRSTKDAMRKVWKEIQSGREWIVDADLKDFFGSVDHAKLLTLVAQRIADGRVLRLIEAMLKAGSYGQGRLFPTERGTPQGSVIHSPNAKDNLRRKVFRMAPRAISDHQQDRRSAVPIRRLEAHAGR